MYSKLKHPITTTGSVQALSGGYDNDFWYVKEIHGQILEYYGFASKTQI